MSYRVVATLLLLLVSAAIGVLYYTAQTPASAGAVTQPVPQQPTNDPYKNLKIP
jgi:hypothetical protein